MMTGYRDSRLTTYQQTGKIGNPTLKNRQKHKKIEEWFK
jgi:hypothetical protein